MTRHNAEILGSLLKRTGNYDGMETFDGRLILQKTIYLMQEFNLNIGYHFSWYIRGPYCTQLSKDGFALREVYESVSEGHFHDPQAERRFGEFLEFIKGHEKDADWLEIIASIHFLKKAYKELDKDAILNIVQNKQKYFTKEQCNKAWDYLESKGMI